ncbi:hypothetical protein WKS98_02390 [Lagierella sp. ICN-221743]
MAIKRLKKLTLIFAFVVLCTTSCKSSKIEGLSSEINSKINTKQEETENNLASKKDLEVVQGAKEGSLSNLVVDREIWNEFMDEKYFAQAKGPRDGFHIPKILLDSKDAKKANKEIEELANGLKKSYETYQDVANSDVLGIFSIFSVYQDENILSVRIQYTDINEADMELNKIYNFSLPDGKLLSDDKVLENFGIKSEDKISLMEEGISNDYKLYKEAYDRNVEDDSFIYNIGNLEGLSLNNLWDTSNDKGNKFFVDEVGRLMFLYTQYMNTEAGTFTEATELGKESINSSPYLNEYVKMARELGVDVKDENKKAFMIYLGSSMDEFSLKEILLKLYPWQEVYYEYKDPSLLLNIRENEETYKHEIMGEEYYLIVPKFKNTTISLKELEISDGGELKERPNYTLEKISLTGPTVICQNISDTAPNAKITLRYKDDVYEFSPSISLKDGSVMLPDEIINAESILDWNMLTRQEMYSNTIFEKIVSLMGRG